jgi:hypothetical protein
VFYGVDHIAGTSFALGPDHGCAFRNAPQGFTQVAGAADKWRLESVLVYVMSFISWR